MFFFFFFRAISSIKGELIPYLVNKQFQKHRKMESSITESPEIKRNFQEPVNSKIGEVELSMSLEHYIRLSNLVLLFCQDAILFLLVLMSS